MECVFETSLTRRVEAVGRCSADVRRHHEPLASSARPFALSQNLLQMDAPLGEQKALFLQLGFAFAQSSRKAREEGRFDADIIFWGGPGPEFLGINPHRSPR